MHYSRTFSFNADFGWYENQVVIHQRSIQLLVSDDIVSDWVFDFDRLHQRLKEVVSWVIKHMHRWEAYCGSLQQGENVELAVISLEQQERFELLFKVQGKERFVLLSFNEAFLLDYWQIDS